MGGEDSKPRNQALGRVAKAAGSGICSKDEGKGEMEQLSDCRVQEISCEHAQTGCGRYCHSINTESLC